MVRNWSERIIKTQTNRRSQFETKIRRGRGEHAAHSANGRNKKWYALDTSSFINENGMFAEIIPSGLEFRLHWFEIMAMKCNIGENSRLLKFNDVVRVVWLDFIQCIIISNVASTSTPLISQKIQSSTSTFIHSSQKPQTELVSITILH